MLILYIATYVAYTTHLAYCIISIRNRSKKIAFTVYLHHLCIPNKYNNLP